MSELIERARNFATRAHQRIDQRRKYSDQPYEVHLEAVARLVASTTDDEEMIAAAWLHDVVEDTPATLEDVRREFGASVAVLVQDLTDVSRPSDGNRAARKEVDRRHLALASPRAKTIKVADLIDNCEDITRNDPRFARVFLQEMDALLGVLGEGDAGLLQRARELHQTCQTKVGEPPPTASAEPSAGLAAVLPHLASPHIVRMFRETFTAGDMFDPLLSFDADRPVSAIARVMASRSQGIAGIRVDGVVQGYVRLPDASDVGDGPAGLRMQPISANQVVDTDAPLTDVVGVLTRHDHCFVSAFGAVIGVIERGAANKPVVRMWLFGAITLYEMGLVPLIERVFPDDAWHGALAPARLDKARQLQNERERRGRPCRLIECLQFSDKAQIMLEHAPTMEKLGFASKKVGKRLIRELESLRNHLVHSQDIVSHDWPQIIRITHRLTELGVY
jgi:hypothetical protein